MSTELYVIKNDDGICSFYSELENAKEELKKIFNKIPDFKYYGYYINVYHMADGKYIYSKTSYSYSFDKFTILIDL